MTPEERDLISGLFERMRSTGVADKDREAEAYIGQLVRQNPDAAYMLVQSVLVQEHALQEAGARIEDLEDRVRDLDRAPQRAAGSGSFLGGLFGGGGSRAPERGSPSVPSVGSRATESVYDAPPRGGPQAWGAGQPGPGGGYGQPPPPQGGGGGFLRGAMTTAAGVAGGMLAAETIRNMLGSGHAQASGGNATPWSTEQLASSTKQPEQQQQQQASEHQEPHYQDANDNDPGNYDSGAQDASYDDENSSWDDGGSDDIET